MQRPSKFLKELSSGSLNAVVNNAILILTYPVFLKFLGAELYGLWTTINSLLVLAQILSVTTGPALTTFIAREKENRNDRNIISYLSSAFFFVLFISGFIIILSFFINRPLVSLLNLEVKYVNIAVNLVPMTVIIISLIIIQAVFEGTLMGLGRIELSNYLSLIMNAGRFVISFLLLLFGLNIWSIPLGWMISVFIMIFLYIHIIQKNLKTRKIFVFKIDRGKLNEIVQFGKYLSFSFISNLGFIPFIKIIIARYSGLANVLYFDIAWKVLVSVKSLIDGASKAIVPHVSRLNAENNKESATYFEQIRKRYSNTLKYSLFIGIPPLLVLFIFSEFILGLWLGSQYNPMITILLRILTAGIVLDILTTPIYFTFIGLKRPEICMYSDLTKTLLTILLISIFICFNSITMIIIAICVTTALSISRIVLIASYIRIIIHPKS